MNRIQRKKQLRKKGAMVGGIMVLSVSLLVLHGLEKKKDAAVSGDTGYAARQLTIVENENDYYLALFGAEQESGSEEGAQEDLLILVNKENPLPEGYEVELQWLQNGSCAVAAVMYVALREMLTDGSVNGRQFVVASGYRDTQLQEQLLEEDIQRAMEEEGLTWREAYEKETRETMPPGYSEHETGLAVDLVALDYQVLDEAQQYTEENIWLRENCSKYGFILRYPLGKEAVTGIDYESWHFRYVGKEVAQKITEKGITLEEYLELQGK